jgi:hypothetical protein
MGSIVEDSFLACLRALLSSSENSERYIANLDSIIAEDHDNPDAQLLSAVAAAEIRSRALQILKRDPNNEHGWGDHPLNGDPERADLVFRLIKAVRFDLIVETGTFRGSTTAFFHEISDAEIYSCELIDRYFEFALDRLGETPRIHLERKDSRIFLTEIAQSQIHEKKSVFFYLDAHWGHDLPLVEEIRIILKHFPSCIVMVDDFEVPGRREFGFDAYGDEAVLSVDLLASEVPADTSLFYPNWPLDPDVDGRRGFVILARGGPLTKVVAGLDAALTRRTLVGALAAQVREYRCMHRAADTEARTAIRQQADQAAAALRRMDQAKAEAQSALRQLDQAKAEADEEKSKRRNALRQAGEINTQIRRNFIEMRRHAGELDARLNDAERRANDAELRLGEALHRANDADLRANDADLRLGEALHRVSDAESRIHNMIRSRRWRYTHQISRVGRELARIRRKSIGRERRKQLYAALRRSLGFFRLVPPPNLQNSDPAPPLSISQEIGASPSFIRSKPVISPEVVGGPESSQWFDSSELSLSSPNIELGPLAFVPHDGGFFSNFNFLIGEMYFGRIVYPLFSLDEITHHQKTLKHFAYADAAFDNSWFEFFKEIEYYPGDGTHRNSRLLSALPNTLGHLAPPEFRMPASTYALYGRPDFSDWRRAVHRVVVDKIRVSDQVQALIDALLARMSGRRIGVHVRHPSHSVEQGLVFFDDYFRTIDGICEQFPEFSLFVASDNELAIAAFQHRYGVERVFCHPNFIRQSIDDVLEWAYSQTQGSSDHMGFVGGVGFQTHYKLAAAGGGSDGIRAGKEAVTEVFTLAACNDFVCTASNFTLACAYLNPEQTLHLISKGVSRSRFDA